MNNALTLTVGEAARELGISSYLAWRLVRKGELPSIRLGKLVRVPRAQLLKVLEGDGIKAGQSKTINDDGAHNVGVQSGMQADPL